MSCFEDEMVILPVSSTKQGLNEDEIGPGRLFSDAELGEDLAEDFVGGDLAGGGAEGGKGGAEVLRQEVGGAAGVEAVGDGGEGSGRLAERRGVTRVRHQSAACGGHAGLRNEGGTQVFEAEAGFGGDC